MQRFMLKSKIHRATVTESNLNYQGSLTIDADLMEAANLTPFEHVHIYNITNGHRFETYVIEGKRGSGTICMNGAAARKVQIGDLIIIASYALMEDQDCVEYHPNIILVDGYNRITER